MNRGIQDITTTMLQPPSVGLSIGNVSIPSAISPQFSPMNIPGCRLWLDADDPYSLTLSGSSVVSWRDKSNNGLDVGYDVQANQPIYTRNYRNGRGAITFGTGGVVSCLRSATPPRTYQGMYWPIGDLSMFVVYEVLTRETSARVFCTTYGTRATEPITAHAGSTDLLIINSTSFSDPNLGIGNVFTTQQSSALNVPSPHYSYDAKAFPETTATGCVNYISVIRPRPNVEEDNSRGTARGGEAQAYLRRNGRSGTPDKVYNRTSYNSHTIYMPQRISLGCTTNNGSPETIYALGLFLKGNIYEIAVFDRITNNGEILALEEYFRAKWCPNQPPVYLQN